jgi:hypothetical protein
MLTNMKIDWRRGFFRAWVALALAWVGFSGWNEYRVWDSYLISLSHGFPSFPHDYAEAASYPGIQLPARFRDAWGRVHVIIGAPGSKDYLELVGRLLASHAQPTYQNTIPMGNSLPSFLR